MAASGTGARLVESLGAALREGDHGLKAVPGLLKRVLSEEAWRSFATQRGELVEHARFADFVTTPPLKGLGANMRLIEKIVDSIEGEADRMEARDLLDRAVQRPVGTNQASAGLDNIQTRHPSGTSREAGLRRLRKDRPDLHAEVLAGRLSTHKAMVRAGFRRDTVTVPVDKPENAARVLRKRFAPEALAEVVRLLSED